MRRKNHGPLHLTSWQVEQLKLITHSLRKLNRDALRELRRIGHTGVTPTQYREAGGSFGSIATRMISALRFRCGVLKAEPEQLRFQLNVRFVTPCVHRSKSKELSRRDDDKAEPEALIPHPAHQAEMASLLELTNSIEARVSRRSVSRGASLDRFFRGIARLRLAVLQQQQDLLATAPQVFQFKLNVADGPEICPDCLKSKEIDGTMEGHDRQV
jgi:hypothetical protein